MKSRATVFVFACVLPSVVWAQAGTLQDLGGALAPSAQTVIYTAREFITMDPAKPHAEAIAVRDGK